MKMIKSKIKKVIQRSNGYPNYTQHEYLDAIRLILNKEFSDEELENIKMKNIDLDKWILEITEKVTDDLL